MCAARAVFRRRRAGRRGLLMGAVLQGSCPPARKDPRQRRDPQRLGRIGVAVLRRPRRRPPPLPVRSGGPIGVTRRLRGEMQALVLVRANRVRVEDDMAAQAPERLHRIAHMTTMFTCPRGQDTTPASKAPKSAPCAGSAAS